MTDFLVLGDINADMAATLPYYPSEGDDSPMTALSWCSGGSAANTAAALALLGGRVTLIGRVGSDPAAAVALSAASRAGVDLRMVQHDANVATGVCMAAVSPSGQRTFFSFRGANVQLEPPVLPASEDRAVLLHLCGHGLMDDPQRSSALAAAELALSMHTLVSLDLCVPTARSRADIVLSMVPRLALLFMNEAELGFLLPGLTWEHALQSLLERGARLVVLKRGGDGCVIATPRATLAIEALPVTVADTNGCGDAFVAGFLWAYIQGASLPGCGAVGNMLGACTATRLGAADALPTLAELGALLEAHPAWSGTPIARDVLVRTLRQRAV